MSDSNRKPSYYDHHSINLIDSPMLVHECIERLLAAGFEKITWMFADRYTLKPGEPAPFMHVMIFVPLPDSIARRPVSDRRLPWGHPWSGSPQAVLVTMEQVQLLIDSTDEVK